MYGNHPCFSHKETSISEKLNIPSPSTQLIHIWSKWHFRACKCEYAVLSNYIIDSNMKNLFRLYAQRKQNCLTGHQVPVFPQWKLLTSTTVFTYSLPKSTQAIKIPAGLLHQSMKWFLPFLPSYFESLYSYCISGLYLLFAYLKFFLFASLDPFTLSMTLDTSTELGIRCSLFSVLNTLVASILWLKDNASLIQ